jgi:hypothetical protein
VIERLAKAQSKHEQGEVLLQAALHDVGEGRYAPSRLEPLEQRLIERLGPTPWHHACTGPFLSLVHLCGLHGMWPLWEVPAPAAVVRTAALLAFERLARMHILVHDSLRTLPERPRGPALTA